MDIIQLKNKFLKYFENHNYYELDDKEIQVKSKYFENEIKLIGTFMNMDTIMYRSVDTLKLDKIKLTAKTVIEAIYKLFNYLYDLRQINSQKQFDEQLGWTFLVNNFDKFDFGKDENNNQLSDEQIVEKIVNRIQHDKIICVEIQYEKSDIDFSSEEFYIFCEIHNKRLVHDYTVTEFLPEWHKKRYVKFVNWKTWHPENDETRDKINDFISYGCKLGIF